MISSSCELARTTTLGLNPNPFSMAVSIFATNFLEFLVLLLTWKRQLDVSGSVHRILPQSGVSYTG